MFSYLRYFAAISLLLVILGAAGLGIYFREIKSQEMLGGSRSSAEAIIASYTETVWQRYFPAIATSTDVTLRTGFLADSQKYFGSFPFTKITIFSPDVKQLYYGSTPAYVTSDGSTRVTLFNISQTQAGQSATRMLRESYLTGGADANTPHVLMQSIVPIFAPGIDIATRQACLAGRATARCQPQALVEIYSDMTEGWKQLEFFQYLIMGTIITTFTLLVSALMYMANRAESIIARQHEVNLELIAAAAQAESQSRDKSQFLASVSHELRTPLNAIIGFSEIIKNEAKSQMQKVYQEYVDDIHASGKHLLSLINDILDYSKAEAGKLQIEWAETDATKVIRNSLRMVLPRAEASQVTLIEDIPSHHLVITTDAKKLKQVLLNLLSNAVKFTPAGGEVRCIAWEDVATKTLIIKVKDTGIGIAPKDISRVMMPFGQVDSTLARRFEGTGLGLPLAKKFIESMGGEFAIESEVDVGTIITLTIPKTPKEMGTTISVTEEESDVTPEQPSTETT
jgi:two-component system cell cycle sensor histidine kinase PleC